MNATLICPERSKSTFILGLLLFFCVTFEIKGQCAGTDNSISVCEISEDKSKTIDLALLLGTHTQGGIWTDLDHSEGFDPTTGILNAQLVKKSGVYTYNYTLTKTADCSNHTANIKVTIGGYTGQPEPSLSICNSEATYNLLKLLTDENSIKPQEGGNWSDDDRSGALSKFTADLNTTKLSSEQPYSYTYTIPAIENCPAVSSKITVNFYQAPKAGRAKDLVLCSTQLADFSHFDLNNQLENQDVQGSWMENSSLRNDSFINIENIYDTRGDGTYSFIYTVKSKNSHCKDQSTAVNITIEKPVDFTGLSVTELPDLCANETMPTTLNMVLRQANVQIVDGEYEITYRISTSAESFTSKQSFSKGQLILPIPTAHFKEAKDYRIQILSIKSHKNTGACTNAFEKIETILKILALPKITDGKLKIEGNCLSNETNFSLTGDSLLGEGDYNVVYDIRGSNTETAKVANLKINAGSGSFIIPNSYLVNKGDNTLTITQLTNTKTGCFSTSKVEVDFTTKKLLDTAELNTSINNNCEGTSASVLLKGLSDLRAITIAYKLSGSNTSHTKRLELYPNNGAAAFELPSNEIPFPGRTIFNITEIAIEETSCSIPVQIQTNFTVMALPTVKVDRESQYFCPDNNPKVSDLLPQGSQYHWYDTETATEPLGPEQLLTTNNYFLIESSTEGCLSLPVRVKVSLQSPEPPLLHPLGNEFCTHDKPTIERLSKNVNFASELFWFDNPIRDNPVAAGHLLKENNAYYGFNYDPVSNCYSSPLVTTIRFDICLVGEDELKIPNGFSPNGDGINDTFEIEDIALSFPNYTLEIFNRYGNSVFKGGGESKAWDGKTGTADLIAGEAPTGVYYYVISFNKDDVPSQQGTLYLNR